MSGMTGAEIVATRRRMALRKRRKTPSLEGVLVWLRVSLVRAACLLTSGSSWRRCREPWSRACELCYCCVDNVLLVRSSVRTECEVVLV